MQVFLPPEELTLKDMTTFLDANNQIDFDAYDAAEKKFIQDVKEWCKANSNCPDAGEELNFPMGDGYAQYILLDYKRMVFLPVGDEWSIADAHARGLRKADLVEMVRINRARTAYFTKKEDTTADLV